MLSRKSDQAQTAEQIKKEFEEVRKRVEELLKKMDEDLARMKGATKT